MSPHISVGRPGASFAALSSLKRRSTSHFLAALVLAAVQLDYLFIFVFVLLVRRRQERVASLQTRVGRAKSI